MEEKKPSEQAPASGGPAVLAELKITAWADGQITATGPIDNLFVMTQLLYAGMNVAIEREKARRDKEEKAKKIMVAGAMPVMRGFPGLPPRRV